MQNSFANTTSAQLIYELYVVQSLWGFYCALRFFLGRFLPLYSLIYVNFHGSSLTYRGEKTSLSFKKVSSFQTGRLFSFICFKVFTFEQKSSLSNRNLLFRTEIFSFEQNSFHPNRKILLLRREKQSEM